jgi:hypothetical protein
MPELLQAIQLDLALLNHLQRQITEPLNERNRAILFLVVDKFDLGQSTSYVDIFANTRQCAMWAILAVRHLCGSSFQVLSRLLSGRSEREVVHRAVSSACGLVASPFPPAFAGRKLKKPFSVTAKPTIYFLCFLH